MKSRQQIKQAVAAQVSSSEYIPFGSHIASDVIKLKRGGDLVATWKLAGISFETKDEADILAAKAGLINLLRSLGGGQWALWSHKIRRRVYERLTGVSDNPFATRLAEDYTASFRNHRQMRTELYLTLVYRPQVGQLPNLFGRLFGRKRGVDEIAATDQQALDELEDAGKMVERAMEAYRPERLGCVPHGGFTYSNMLRLYGYLVNGVWEDIPVRKAAIDQYLPASRLHFGDTNGRLQIVHPTRQRFVGFLDIQDYPRWTESGIGNAVLYSDYEYIETQSFSSLNRRDAQEALERQRGHMQAAEDASVSEINDITSALDDLVSGQMEVGEYHYTLAVMTETADALTKGMAERAVRNDAECGAVGRNPGVDRR